MSYKAMMAANHWLLCSIVDGVKIPCSGHTGLACDSTDPRNWMSYADICVAMMKFPGMRLAFALGGKFFLLDGDKCGSPGLWDQIVHDLNEYVPGALFEVSQSGHGVHWIGVAAAPIEHSCKNTKLGIELYTDNRFVCLGDMTTAQGDSGTVVDLTALVRTYFQPGAGKTDVQWSDQPVPEWDGHLDDHELIQAARKSKSSNVFAGKASFEDLWTANVTVLAGCYPVQNNTAAYDESSVDGALALHLSFWTGKDCERMLRIMRMCTALTRDKWKRADYLKVTVSSAVGLGGDVYGSGKVPPPIATQGVIAPRPVVEPGPMLGAHTGRNSDALIGMIEFRDHFSDWVYLESPHRMLNVSTGNQTTPVAFKARHGGHEYYLGEIDGKAILEKDAFKAYTETRCFDMLKVRDARFRPDLPVSTISTEAGEKYINKYVPHIPARAKGMDVSPFTNQLKRMFPFGDDTLILVSYIAAVVQNPGKKFQWAPVMVGAEGNGKTFVMTCLAEIVGSQFTRAPSPDDLGNKFNAWMDGTLLAVIEEINAKGNHEIMDAVKVFITNERVEIQPKGVDAYSTLNFVNFILGTNHIDGVPTNDGTRRFCVLVANQMCIDDMHRDFPEPDYFPDLWNWAKHEGGYAAIAEFLLTMEIDERYNPAGNCRRAPKSTTSDQAVAASLGVVEQEIAACVEEEHYGFSGGWVSSKKLDEMLKERGLDKRVPRNGRKAVLESMGYVIHPGLPSGRVNNLISKSDGKPTLYVKKDSIMAQNHGSPPEIVDAYVKAQMPPPMIGEVPHGQLKK